MVSMRDLWRRSTRMFHSPDGGGGTSIESLPCAVCGEHAATWNYGAILRGGTQVIEGAPVCAEHDQLRSREVAG